MMGDSTSDDARMSLLAALLCSRLQDSEDDLRAAADQVLDHLTLLGYTIITTARVLDVEVAADDYFSPSDLGGDLGAAIRALRR